MAVTAACAVDLRRAPRDQWSTRAALQVIGLYQRTLSPRLPALGVECRFTPSCSRYAQAMLRRHGIIGAAWPTIRRLARCGPWTPTGTVDPPGV